MIMEMWLNKNLERYFKKYGKDTVFIDGVVFYGEKKSETEFYLKDWRDNLFLATRTPGKRYILEIAKNTVSSYHSVVCFYGNEIAKIILCEDLQEVKAIVNYAKLPFCGYDEIEIFNVVDFKHGTPVIFYKTALEYIKEHLPI